MRYGQHGYKEAECCFYCLFYVGGFPGARCRRFDKPVTKTKVCDYFTEPKTVEEWEGRGVMIPTN